jgi:hypothetical protein
MCSGGSGDALADLEHALDRVAGQDLKGLFGPQVLERTRSLLTLKNRVDAELARTVREGELTQASDHDGAKTMQSWLRGHGPLVFVGAPGGGFRAGAGAPAGGGGGVRRRAGHR